jgi:hypothetical protein
MKFRERSAVVEAEQWFAVDDPNNGPLAKLVEQYSAFDADGRCSAIGNRCCVVCGKPLRDHGEIYILDDWWTVCSGDWIIKYANGDLYPCGPDVFEASYEPVGEE